MQKDKIEQRLTRSAYAYLDRYGSSVHNLKTVLRRKARRFLDDDAIANEELEIIIEAVVGKCQSYGFVDDKVFAHSKVSSLRRKGGSTRKIMASLAAKGIDQDTAQQAIETVQVDDGEAAARYAQRRRLGPFRTSEDDRSARRDRDIAAMCRAGFGVSLAIKVIDGEIDGQGED